MIICPRCRQPLNQQPVKTVFGFKDSQVELLAEGALLISFCPNCLVAVLSEQAEEAEIILPTDSQIIIP